MSKQATRKRAVQPPQHTGTMIPGWQSVRAFLASVLPVLAIVTVTRVALAEAYHIPSGSMEPTLLVGDWLFVNKLRFGPHIPFTKLSLPGYASPKRRDVVVFESPSQDPSIRMSPEDSTPTLVKRIVAVGGDTIAMRAGRLFVNGTAEVGPPVHAPVMGMLADEAQPIFQWQHRIELSSSRLGEAARTPTLHEWGPLVVPAGQYFMMGDNRDDSVDSRFYGTVPRGNLRGTPTFVYYSFDTEDGLDYLRAVTAIRWSRLGTWIK